MRTFRVENTQNGFVFGEYPAQTAQQAIELMAQDIGYTDAEQICRAFAIDAEALRASPIDTDGTTPAPKVPPMIAAKHHHLENQVDPDDTLENWIATRFGWDDVQITDGGDVRYVLAAGSRAWHPVTAAQFGEIMRLYHEIAPWAPDRRTASRQRQ
jgi:hypothetical protein